MITKEQIIEILYKNAGFIDRSRWDQAVHENNFNDVADEILSKLSQNDVSRSGGFDKGYEQGYNDATREACKEIAKNYQPNDR